MSHPEQLDFFRVVAEANRELLAGASLLEIGSFDVNGSVRSIFDSVHQYSGVDLVAGPGVDIVDYGHMVDMADASLDVTISSECFEHDPHWVQTFLNMIRMTRPGGLVVVTCAGRGRFEHGTVRTGAECSPGTQFQGLDYYRNLTSAEFELLPLASFFADYRFWYEPRHRDLYFAGVRSGTTSKAAGRIPAFEVRQIRSRTQVSPSVYIAQLPLRALAKLLPDRRYQDVAVAYLSAGRRLARRSSG